MKFSSPFGTIRIYQNGPEGAPHALLAPGYSEGIVPIEATVDALAEEGFRVTTFDQPKRDFREADPIDRLGGVVLKVCELLSRANDAAQYGVGHSLGCSALLRAGARLNVFDGMVLMQPDGFARHQDFWRSAGNAGTKNVKDFFGAFKGQPRRGQPRVHPDTESRPRFVARVVRAEAIGVAALLKNPRLSIREAVAAGRYDAEPDLRTIQEQSGIPVHLVGSYRDEMFAQEQTNSGAKHALDLLASYSMVNDPAARHDTMWLQPRRSAAIIGQLLRECRALPQL